MVSVPGVIVLRLGRLQSRAEALAAADALAEADVLAEADGATALGAAEAALGGAALGAGVAALEQPARMSAAPRTAIRDRIFM